MKLSDIGTSVETLGGIGPSTARLFARMNIFTVADLLETYPRDYEDRTKKIQLCNFAAGKVHTICKVMSHEWFGYGRMKTLKLAVTDGSANAFLIAFNRPFLAKSLPEGSIICVTGKFEVRYNVLQCSSFEAEKIADEGELKDYENFLPPDTGLLPIYPLTEGLSQKNFRKAVSLALRQYAKGLDDEIPQDIIKERNLLHKSQAIEKIHVPPKIQDVEEARKSICYEELFNFETKMALRTFEHRGSLPHFSEEDFDPSLLKAKIEKEENENSEKKDRAEINGQKVNAESLALFKSPPEIEAQFIASLSPKQQELFKRLSFNLTKGQMEVILQMNNDIDKSQSELFSFENKNDEWEKDCSRPPFSMQRLLQGDVGSGKTLVSFFVCLREIDYGFQCALLAPTELLARQHAENAAKMLEVLGVKVAFLTGNLKSKGRGMLLSALENGEINIVVGTHALFSSQVHYKKLGLAVIDEQHRFGVAQRESIIAKGRISKGKFAHTPDLLMMSATPIPQTLALTVFGDLDVSVIKTMPEGRKPVRTYLSVMGNERNVYEAVRKELEKGHQAYFVYPRIGEEELEDKEKNASFRENEESSSGLKSAQDMFNFLSKEVYPQYKCSIIHGKIEEEEQKKILEDFQKGNTQLLVATTVVEVGVDVPNASCIVIEHADRFGLAELHQLRGRVGRSSLQSYCFLIYSKNISQSGKERLKALHESNDGFFIAEEDLRLRGGGELLGTAQSGYLSLGLADLERDKEILKIARYDAFKNLEKTLIRL